MSQMDAILSDCRRSLAATGVDPLQALRGTRLLVTGATGFAGSWILAVLACLNDDHGFGVEITAAARHRHPDPTLATFLGTRDDVRVVQTDVRQIVELPSQVAWIVHAAANPDNRVHATDPIGTASVIGEGTAHLLRLAVQAENLRAVLNFSSGLVAHGAEGGRIGANSVYVEAKRYGEALCAAYRTQARVPVVVTRPHTFIGPFQPLTAPWAANNLMYAALAGQPLKLLGGGETSRAYLYGSDMAVLALHQLVRGRSGETFDLGGTQAVPVMDLARIIVAEVRRPLEIRANTGGRDVSHAPFVPDMTPSVERFGFRPAFDTAEAIRRTLEWHSDAQRRNVA